MTVFVQHPTDPAQDCFLHRKRNTSGAEVIRINASTFFVDTLSTTGGSAIPLNRGGGAYSKFIYVPSLGGIAYATIWEANVWFLRTS